MKWSANIKLLTIKDEAFIDKFFWFVTGMLAEYFMGEMISQEKVPAWTGQARASMTKAINLINQTVPGAVLGINFSDVQEKGRDYKNIDTGIAQGKAKWFFEDKQYGFGFYSWVADLEKDPTNNYWEDNEYFSTPYSNNRQTPWHTIREAGTETMAWAVTALGPLFKDFFNRDIYIVGYISV